MPLPSQSDLHVNVPLTNVSVAFVQSADTYIADKIFPRVPVQKQSDLYYKHNKTDWRRTDVKRRAPGTESPGSGWTQTQDTYFAHVYAVHKDIHDQETANADSVFNLDRSSTEFVTNQLLLHRDQQWASNYFKTGVWESEFTGVSSSPGASQFLQWSDAASDPLGDVARWTLNFRKRTGYAPNKLVLGAEVLVALKQHPDIIDRIKYTQKGVVTTELLASFFDIPNVYVSYATQATGPQIPDSKAQDAAATIDFINSPKSVLMCYATGSPSVNEPTAGYVFTWNGYLAGNSRGLRIKRFRMEPIASNRIEGEMTYDMKVVCPEMGVFLNTAVA